MKRGHATHNGGAGASMPPSNLISALEELAAKRRELTSAILTLASVAGVSAESYLAYDRNLTPAIPLPAPVSNGMPAKDPKPPRPQRPASRATNGTGRAHKGQTHDALSPTAQSILDAVAKAKDPMAPRDLAKATGVDVSVVSYHVRNLAKAGRVATSGNTSNRRVSLP